MANRIEEQYRALLGTLLENSTEKSDRTGTGTRSVFGRQIRHQMKGGFPLLTTKRMAVKTMMTELKWFLKGDTNIKYLVDNGCKVWNGDAYKKYRDVYEIESRENDSKLEELHMLSDLTEKEFIDRIKGDDEFARIWGELGPIYGKQWRSWSPVAGDINKGGKDQIQNLINELKTNPDSRRLMVSAWNVGELSEMTLPPCHYGFQMYTRELTFDERYKIYSNSDQTWEEGGGNAYGKITAMDLMDDDDIPTRSISLMWNQRSVDTFLGLPFNIASYGLLLEIIAKEVNMIPDELIGILGDVHLYSNHIEQAKEQIGRDSFDLPSICLDYREGEYNKNLTDLTYEDFVLFRYESHPTIKAPLSN